MNEITWVDRLCQWADDNDISINDLPRDRGQLLILQTLNLRSSQLRNIPKEIGKLTDLTELNLEGNELTSFPKEIGQLTNLTGLYLIEFFQNSNNSYFA